MKSATHSDNNKGASIPSLFSVLISEYLGLGSSTSPTWDRTRFQQTRGRGASGKRRYDTHILLNQARTISSAGNKMCWMVLTEDVLKEHRMHTNNDSARVSFPEAPTDV